MTSNSFCQLTCGACSASSGGSATPPAAAGAIAASTGVPPAAATNASETSGEALCDARVAMACTVTPGTGHGRNDAPAHSAGVELQVKCSLPLRLEAFRRTLSLRHRRRLRHRHPRHRHPRHRHPRHHRRLAATPAAITTPHRARREIALRSCVSRHSSCSYSSAAFPA